MKLLICLLSFVILSSFTSSVRKNTLTITIVYNPITNTLDITWSDWSVGAYAAVNKSGSGTHWRTLNTLIIGSDYQYQLPVNPKGYYQLRVYCIDGDCSTPEVFSNIVHVE